MENEGLLSQRGLFRTNVDDSKALLTNHVPLARKRWELEPKEPMDIAIYAHGGLTDENAAAETARVWVPHLYTRGLTLPIFLMWETGAVADAAQHIPGRHTRRSGDRRRGRPMGAVQRAVFGMEGRATGRIRAVSGRPDVGGDEAERGCAHEARGSRRRAAIPAVQDPSDAGGAAARSPSPDRALGRRHRPLVSRQARAGIRMLSREVDLAACARRAARAFEQLLGEPSRSTRFAC